MTCLPLLLSFATECRRKYDGRVRVAIVYLLLFAFGASRVWAQASVVTQHNDNGRTGQNVNETVLTPSNVTSAKFGKLFSQPVDGQVYAQPLYLPNVTIGGVAHNVVIVATEADSVYAFDADSKTGASASPLWKASLLDTAHGAAAGATTVTSSDSNCDLITPVIGITSTPVIDPATGTIYVEAKSKENGSFVHRLHALDITTGAEKGFGPVAITATVNGNGDGASNGAITFNGLTQVSRSGLLLVNGTVYVAYASPCDVSPYHGWLFAYNATNLGPEAAFITTPNGGLGGIWNSGAGLASDGSGNLFVATGNGTFDSSHIPATELSDSILKLSLSGSAFSLVDYFTPYNQSSLSNQDTDIGSGGLVLLPDQPGAHPHELVQTSKAGVIYLIDRDTMTTSNLHYCTSGCGGTDPQIVQELNGAIGGAWSTPAYWNNTLYIWGASDVLKAFPLNNGQLGSVTSRGGTSVGSYGVTPSISANGTTAGIVWAVVGSGSTAVLHAYDATNLQGELYNSTTAANNRDRMGSMVKFTVPTVVNGKVYAGNAAELDVFGLIAAPTLVSISVTPAHPSIAQGTARQFTATGTYSDNSTQDLTGSVMWTSTNTNVATINGTGLASAAATGSTTIAAASGSISGSTTLTVTVPGTLVSISVAPANVSIGQGGTQPFTATGTYSDNSTQDLTSSVTWSSTNSSVATINSAGLASGGGAGSASISAVLGPVNGSASLTVTSLPSGLVGHWTFDDGTGTTAKDSSGNAYNATLTGGIGWVAGKMGGGISANGSNQSGSISAINLTGAHAVTVAMWVNRTYSKVGAHTLLENSTNFNNSTTGFGVFPDDDGCGGIMVGVNGNVGYSINCFTQPSSGVWHHLAVIFDKSQAGNKQTVLYIDGVLQTPSRTESAAANTNAFGTNPIYLFARGGIQEYISGQLDELQIYNRALSLSEVQGIYNLENGGARLVSISVSPANSSIAQGAGQQFTATGTYSDNSTQNLTGSVTWSSSNTGVATINAAGLANGAGAGNTTIAAASGSIDGSTALTVNARTLVSISVTPASASIAQGSGQQFTATGTYSDSSMQNLTGSVAWNSTNIAVATISAAGLASGIGGGSTSISATSGSVSGSTTLAVIARTLVSIAVTPVNSLIGLGGTKQFTAIGTYNDNGTQNLTSSVTWSSSNTNVATMNSAGLASGAAVGSTSIGAALGSVAGSTALTVNSLPSDLVGHWTFDEGSGAIAKDSSGNGYNAALANGVTWVSGKTGTAISANGTNHSASIPAINLSGASAVTVAMWVNRTYSKVGGHALFESSPNYNNSTTGFGVFPDDSTCKGIMIGVHGNVGYSVNCYAQPSSGVWHHLVVVFDKTQTGRKQTALYIDGVLQTPTLNPYTSANTNLFGNNLIYLFARAGQQEYTAGQMDELQIYNRALSVAEIQGLP